MKANIPPRSLHHETLVEKIIWFTDACLTGTEITPIDQRFDNLESDPKNGVWNIEFSNSFSPLYDGRSLYDVQRGLGLNYAQEFADILQIKPDEIYEWLKNTIATRLQTNDLPIFEN